MPRKRAEKKTAVDWSKPVETNEHHARQGRIICTDALGEYPVIMLFVEGDKGGEFPFRFTRDGLSTCGTYQMINQYAATSWWFFCRNVKNSQISQHGPYHNQLKARVVGKAFCAKTKDLVLVGTKKTVERIKEGEGLDA